MDPMKNEAFKHYMLTGKDDLAKKMLGCTDEEFEEVKKAWSESARTSANMAKGLSGSHSIVNVRPTGTGTMQAVAHGGARGGPYLKVNGAVAHVKDRMTNAIQKLQSEGLWHKGESKAAKFGGGAMRGPKFDLKPGQGWSKAAAKNWSEKAQSALDKAGFKDVQLGTHQG